MRTRLRVAAALGLALLLSGRTPAADKLDVQDGRRPAARRERQAPARRARLPRRPAAEGRRRRHQGRRQGPRRREAPELLDPHVLVQVTINPESRGQGGPRPGGGEAAAERLRPRAGQGGQRQHREEQAATSPARRPGRSSPAASRATRASPTRTASSHVEMFTSPPMTAEPQRPEGRSTPSPCSTAARPASARSTLGFDVGQGTQDLGFRGEVPVLFEVRPGDPGEADHHATSTARRRPAASPSATRPAASTRRRPSAWPPTSSSRSRSTATTAAPSCCRRASSP